MIEFIAHNLAPIMFVSLMVFLLLGYPVAFALAANGLLFFVIGVELAPLSDSISIAWPLLNAWPERIFPVMSNDTLLAIPFFTFMGIVLERSGIAQGILSNTASSQLVHGAIVTGALLAAETGVVDTSVIALSAVGALAVTASTGRLSLDIVRQALAAATCLSTVVLFILFGLRIFSFTFYSVNGQEWAGHLWTAAPEGGPGGFMVWVAKAILFAGLVVLFLNGVSGIIKTIAMGSRIEALSGEPRA